MNVTESRPFRVPFILPLLAQFHVFARDGLGPLADTMKFGNGNKNWNLQIEASGFQIGTASVSVRFFFLCAGRDGGSARNAYKMIGEAN